MTPSALGFVANIYLLKVYYSRTLFYCSRITCEICKVDYKDIRTRSITSVVFIVNFELTSHLLLVLQL